MNDKIQAFSIHRFIVHFCGKAISVVYFYAGLGFVFSLKVFLADLKFAKSHIVNIFLNQALLLVAIFIFGIDERSEIYWTRTLKLLIPTGVCYCFWIIPKKNNNNNNYLLQIIALVWMLTLPIAPVLSLLVIVKRLVKKEQSMFLTIQRGFFSVFCW